MSALLLVLALLSTFYVLTPLLAMASLRQSPPRTRRVPPQEAPEPVSRAISRWGKELGPAGASLVAVHRIASSLVGEEDDAGAAGHVLHYTDQAAGVHGMDYVTPHGQWQVFLTRLEDGREVVTTNYARAMTTTPHPRVHVARMPGVRKLGWLRSLHGVHVARVQGAAAPAAIPADEQLADFVADHERRTLERQREVGAMVCDGDVYRPTLRGAFTSAWRQLPPLLWVNRARDRRLERSLTAALKPA